MKLVKLATLLAISMELKKPLFGGESYISLKESELAKIEDALNAGSTGDKETSSEASSNETEGKEKQTLEARVGELTAQVQALEETIKGIEEAVAQALDLNGLALEKDLMANITLLGKTCKEYGDKKPTHTLPANNGQEAAQENYEGVVNMQDEHNRL